MADLFDSQENLFVKVAQFEEIYPRLDDAIVEWTERGEGVFHLASVSSGHYEHRASLKQYGELLRCSKPGCKQGGFDLSSLVKVMAEAGAKERSGEYRCKGTIASDQQNKRQACPNAIKYKITLTYKE
ncbi:hypothetical protein ACFL5X_00765 [Candidatus Omnitrophota bacterium]